MSILHCCCQRLNEKCSARHAAAWGRGVIEQHVTQAALRDCKLDVGDGWVLQRAQERVMKEGGAPNCKVLQGCAHATVREERAQTQLKRASADKMRTAGTRVRWHARHQGAEARLQLGKGAPPWRAVRGCAALAARRCVKGLFKLRHHMPQQGIVLGGSMGAVGCGIRGALGAATSRSVRARGTWVCVQRQKPLKPSDAGRGHHKG